MSDKISLKTQSFKRYFCTHKKNYYYKRISEYNIQKNLFVNIYHLFNKPEQKDKLTSHEEKADKSKWAPAWVKAPVVSFWEQTKQY